MSGFVWVSGTVSLSSFLIVLPACFKLPAAGAAYNRFVAYTGRDGVAGKLKSVAYHTAPLVGGSHNADSERSQA